MTYKTPAEPITVHTTSVDIFLKKLKPIMARTISQLQLLHCHALDRSANTFVTLILQMKAHNFHCWVKSSVELPDLVFFFLGLRCRIGFCQHKITYYDININMPLNTKIETTQLFMMNPIVCFIFNFRTEIHY